MLDGFNSFHPTSFLRMLLPMKSIQLVLLDRDGVINYDSPDYILNPEQWKPIPGSLEAIARLNAAGMKVAVCSNQSALGRGMITQDVFAAIQNKMVAETHKVGGSFDYIAYCPHGPNGGCDCRKPKAGMLLEVMDALGIHDKEAVLMVGDSLRDIEAAHTAAVQGMLVSSGYGDAVVIHEKAKVLMPDILSLANLAEAVNHILSDQQESQS